MVCTERLVLLGYSYQDKCTMQIIGECFRIYLATTLTNRNDIHNEIRRRISSGNVYYYYYYSLRNLSSFIVPSTFHSAEGRGIQNSNFVIYFVRGDYKCLKTKLFREPLGPNKDEVSEQLRILCNAELRDLYRSILLVEQ